MKKYIIKVKFNRFIIYGSKSIIDVYFIETYSKETNHEEFNVIKSCPKEKEQCVSGIICKCQIVKNNNDKYIMSI